MYFTGNAHEYDWGLENEHDDIILPYSTYFNHHIIIKMIIV